MNEKQPIFKKSISGLLLAIVLSIFFIQRGDKSRASFDNVTGAIMSFEKINENYPRRDPSKFRYLQIENYPKPFEIFVGKSTGDFKPKFENIDKLRIGDIVTIYYTEDGKTQNKPVNNLVYFIDKGKEVIFIEGNSKKNLVYGLIGFCLIMILTLVILKWKGKII